MKRTHKSLSADTKAHRCEKMQALDPFEHWWIDTVYQLNVETENYGHGEDEESCSGFSCIPIEFCPFCGAKLK